MLSKYSFLRLSAIAVALVSVGLPIRVATILNGMNFRGHVHPSVWLIEGTSIVLCFVLSRLIRKSDGGLSRAVYTCAWAGVLLCVMHFLTPMPARWW
jgi:hypothetical protein